MISLLLALAAQTTSLKLPPAQALPPPAAEEQPVLARIDGIFAALEAGDSGALLGQVYPDGRVTAVGDLRGGARGVRQESFSHFARRMKPGAGFRERISDPAVEIDGDVAMVWAPFTVSVGGKVVSCGFDHFDLVRENGVWKLMNITFSTRTAGCPAQ